MAQACTPTPCSPAAAALRAVAFRTDKDSEPTTPPSFTADSAKQLLNSKTAEAGSALSDAATTLLATAQVRRATLCLHLEGGRLPR